MPQIVINLSVESARRFRNALSNGRDAALPEDELEGSGPATIEDAKAFIVQYIRKYVRSIEHQQAAQAAREAKDEEPDLDIT